MENNMNNEIDTTMNIEDKDSTQSPSLEFEYNTSPADTDLENVSGTSKEDYRVPSEEEVIKMRNALDAMPLESLIIMQRQYNLANDPGKIKAREKRRRENKAAKAARKVNRQNKKR